MDIEIFTMHYSIEEIDRRSNGAPLYNILHQSGPTAFTGTLPECVAYLQLKAWDIEGILKTTGRHDL